MGVDCGGSCPTACPTCTDGIENGDELGVDCGGSCPTACSTCTDGVENGDELGVDCGGSCPNNCSNPNPIINDPTIYDPCFCGNPLNIIKTTNGLDLVERFHDFALITDDPGETWTLIAVNSGDVLDATGVAIQIGTPLVYNATLGTYRLDLYHNPEIGFTASFARTSDGFVLTTGGSCIQCSSMIPTMSQWGLMIFGLLILNMSLIFLGRMELV